MTTPILTPRSSTGRGEFGLSEEQRRAVRKLVTLAGGQGRGAAGLLVIEPERHGELPGFALAQGGDAVLGQLWRGSAGDRP